MWLETLLKATGGAVLLLLPLTACRILGLPKPQTGFWPRLLGALLLGVAAASYAEGVGWRGIGPTGLILINFISASAIFALLVLQRAAETARGRLVLSVLAGLLVLLSLLEIAHI
ncbi:MAG: ABC transporter permease [Filomicrobium sp.]|nr:ABC transporter permease [Filomicrobium sp.]